MRSNKQETKARMEVRAKGWQLSLQASLDDDDDDDNDDDDDGADDADADREY